MAQKRRAAAAAAQKPPARDEDSDSDDAPEEVSMSSGRDVAGKRRRAEEVGRAAVNARTKERNKKQNDTFTEQAKKRAANAALPPPAAPAPLPDDVLKAMEAAESTKKKVEHPERYVLGRNPRGAEYEEAEEDEDEDGGAFPANEDGDEEKEIGFGTTIGRVASHSGRSASHVVWSSDSDDDGGGSDSEDEDDEGGGGVQPVVLEERLANKPKVVDFRREHLYGARLNRQNGLLSMAKRGKAKAPSSRF